MLYLVAGGPRHIYTICFLAVFAIPVYSFIYVLLPRFLQQRKRIAGFVLGFIAVYLLTLWASFYASSFFFSFWDGPVLFKMKFGLALHNQTLAMSIAGAALGIKATKSWYTRQKENLHLVQQRAKSQALFAKANLYPEFILEALNILHLKITSGSRESPELLLKLSDTLSYILYESQQDLVALEQELKMVNNMVNFRNLQSPGSIKIDYSNTGSLENKFIAPLTLFEITQNLLQSISIDAHSLKRIHLCIKIENHSLLVLFRETEPSTCDDAILTEPQKKRHNIYYASGAAYSPVYESKPYEDEFTSSTSFPLVSGYRAAFQPDLLQPKNNVLE